MQAAVWLPPALPDPLAGGAGQAAFGRLKAGAKASGYTRGNRYESGPPMRDVSGVRQTDAVLAASVA
jgi:hypothetical protein